MSAITRRHGLLVDRLGKIEITTNGDDPKRIAYNAALALSKAWFPKWEQPLKEHKRLGEADAELDELERLIKVAEGVS